jgi:hypothetical protein
LVAWYQQRASKLIHVR